MRRQPAARGALAFVRFRHTDSDEVRNARQQDFIRWAKDQYSTGQLLVNAARCCGSSASTPDDHSLHTTRVSWTSSTWRSTPTVLSSRRSSSRRRSAPASRVSQTPVTSSRSARHSSSRRTPTSSRPRPRFRTSPSRASSPASRNDANTASAAPHARRLAGMIPTPRTATHRPASSATSACRSTSRSTSPTITRTASQSQRTATSPRTRSPSTTTPIRAATRSTGRAIEVRGVCDDAGASSGDETDLATGQYSTVQGTTWQDPPILPSHTQIQIVEGKKLFQYSQGGLIAPSHGTPSRACTGSPTRFRN